MSDTWTIGELAEHAARALRAGAPPPANGRVRDVPGERLIRWYTTIGLVDPPLTRRGRVARYGRRHLLQLVAVKRLQAAGRSIAEIQVALAGATNQTLEAAALLDTPPWPDGGALPLDDHLTDGHTVGEPLVTPERDGPGGGEPVRGRFWTERPANGPPRGADVARGAVVTGVRLGDGVRLVLDAGRTPSEEDVQAVLAAAGPLLAVLEERELT
ncbi:helix-turn-helix domain-containing protein [Nonomuraea sp. NPDC004297]